MIDDEPFEWLNKDEVAILSAVLKIAEVVTTLQAVIALPDDLVKRVADAVRANERHYQTVGLHSPKDIPELIRISNALADILEGK